jgi:NAD(P)H-hydrate epimerase
MTASPLPCPLYTAAGVRALDRYAIEIGGIPGLTLMQRAGDNAFAILRERWPGAKRIVVLCGMGNNGGDGYVVARLAHQAGLTVTLMQIGDATRLKGDARAAAEIAMASGITPGPVDVEAIGKADLIVDALLGTGLDREVSGEFLRAIEAIHQSEAPVLAIDIPSGLNADTGQVMGSAVSADATVTFIGLKQGLFTGAGPDHCGKIYFSGLQLPAETYAAAAPSAKRLELSQFAPLLRPRRRSAHKGHFGHVLVIGGDHGYAGAARMAAEAAARAGAGLVSIASHAATLVAARPELMCHGIEEPQQLTRLLDQATVVAIGPGLGQSDWGKKLLARVLELNRPMVLDADALNLLAEEPIHNDRWVLTPHPGEAARLLDCTTVGVQADRFRAAREIQARYGGVCVLKGTGTLVANSAGDIGVCTAGNPGMASGGMGDVLTGVIAGLLAQRIAPYEAACLGVCLHAHAADLAAQDGERGLLATDLLPWIRRLVNPA